MSRLSRLVVALLVTAVFAAAGASAQTVLKVGATPVPHAEILEFVKPFLAEEGIDLQVIEFTDYNRPNRALADREIDANFFQHIPFLETFNADHRQNLAVLVKVHIEPLGLYSRRIKSLDELQNGAQIGIPNDATNGGRALLLLESAGLIRLKPGVGTTATIFDIVENPKRLRFWEIEAASLPRQLQDLDAAVINTNYALEAKIDPIREAIIMEGSESVYVNVVAVRPEDVHRPELEALAKALTRPEVRAFILESYGGAVVPVF